jgi:hypothetical protein
MASSCKEEKNKGGQHLYLLEGESFLIPQRSLNDEEGKKQTDTERQYPKRGVCGVTLDGTKRER